MVKIVTNWGGNIDLTSGQESVPSDLGSLKKELSSSRVRPLGSKHSFSPLVVTDGVMLSSIGVSFEPAIDQKAMTVTAPAGMRYGALATFLESHGLALPNMGSLPQISIAGASATGTHGSGDSNPVLSDVIAEITYLDANGKVKTVVRGHEHFEALRIGMGAYGIWISVKLKVISSFQMRQDVYHNVSWDAWDSDPTNLTGAGYSVSIFTDWNPESIALVWVKSRLEDREPPKVLFGQKADDGSTNPLAQDANDNLTVRGGLPGPWSERLPHFRIGVEPSAGEEIQTEYFVERKHAVAASRILRDLHTEIKDVLIWSEIRSIARDEAWLSPMRRGDSIALHFTWKLQPEAVQIAISKIEAALQQFEPIPHWGKLHGFTKEDLETLHPMLTEARVLFDELDPDGKFANDYLRLTGVRS